MDSQTESSCIKIHALLHSLIYSFSRQVWSVCYVPSTRLCAGNTRQGGHVAFLRVPRAGELGRCAVRAGWGVKWQVTVSTDGYCPHSSCE